MGSGSKSISTYSSQTSFICQIGLDFKLNQIYDKNNKPIIHNSFIYMITVNYTQGNLSKKRVQSIALREAPAIMMIGGVKAKGINK